MASNPAVYISNILMNEKDYEKLVFGMAHQIRNPCAIILANANLLIQTPGLEQETLRSLQSIVNGAKYLEARLDEFVEFSKPIIMNVKEVPAEKLLNEAVSLFKEKCKLKMTEISSTVDGNLTMPMADHDQLLLALLNVVLNAVESIKEGGKVSLKAVDPGEGTLLITVTDSGAGIHPRDLPEVFSPFYSTKQGGIGIGLSVSKKIIEAHNGSIDLSSALGKGTTVSIRLPGSRK